MKKLVVLAIIIMLFTSCASFSVEWLLMGKDEGQALLYDTVARFSYADERHEFDEIYNESMRIITHFKLDDIATVKANARLKQLAMRNNQPWFEDIQGNIQNIYTEVEKTILNEAIEDLNISILLDWYDDYAEYSPYSGRYSDEGSEQEQQVLLTAVKIEEELLAKAIDENSDIIIKEYFTAKPYERFQQQELQTIWKNRWKNSERILIAEFNSAIALKEEEAVFNNAILEENPRIYTEKYPEGNFDATSIPINHEKIAYEEAYTSLENAEQFVQNYPDSEHAFEVNKFIIREKWYASETYKNALQDIPEEMLNATVMTRQGIDDIGATFKELFLDKAFIATKSFDVGKNGVTVKLKGGEGLGFTITIKTTYSPLYGGMMYIDSIVLREGIKFENYKTHEEKVYFIMVLLQMSV